MNERIKTKWIYVLISLGLLGIFAQAFFINYYVVTDSYPSFLSVLQFIAGALTIIGFTGLLTFKNRRNMVAGTCLLFGSIALLAVWAYGFMNDITSYSSAMIGIHVIISSLSDALIASSLLVLAVAILTSGNGFRGIALLISIAAFSVTAVNHILDMDASYGAAYMASQLLNAVFDLALPAALILVSSKKESFLRMLSGDYEDDGFYFANLKARSVRTVCIVSLALLLIPFASNVISIFIEGATVAHIFMTVINALIITFVFFLCFLRKSRSDVLAALSLLIFVASLLFLLIFRSDAQQDGLMIVLCSYAAVFFAFYMSVLSKGRAVKLFASAVFIAAVCMMPAYAFAAGKLMTYTCAPALAFLFIALFLSVAEERVCCDFVMKHRLEPKVKRLFPVEAPVLQRSVAVHLTLYVLTIGVYGYVWIYKVCNSINYVFNEYRMGAVKELLLCLLVPFYAAYWYSKSAKMISEANKKYGIYDEKCDGIAAGYCLLGLSAVSSSLLQHKLNVIVEADAQKNGLTETDAITYKNTEYSTSKFFWLSMLMGGFYTLYFVFKSSLTLKMKMKNKSAVNPGKDLILCTFVPFYIIFWMHKNAVRIKKLGAARGMDFSSLPFGVTALSVAGLSVLGMVIAKNRLDIIEIVEYKKRGIGIFDNHLAYEEGDYTEIYSDHKLGRRLGAAIVAAMLLIATLSFAFGAWQEDSQTYRAAANLVSVGDYVGAMELAAKTSESAQLKISSLIDQNLKAKMDAAIISSDPSAVKALYEEARSIGKEGAVAEKVFVALSGLTDVDFDILTEAYDAASDKTQIDTIVTTKFKQSIAASNAYNAVNWLKLALMNESTSRDEYMDQVKGIAPAYIKLKALAGADNELTTILQLLNELGINSEEVEAATTNGQYLINARGYITNKDYVSAKAELAKIADQSWCEIENEKVETYFSFVGSWAREGIRYSGGTKDYTTASKSEYPDGTFSFTFFEDGKVYMKIDAIEGVRWTSVVFYGMSNYATFDVAYDKLTLIFGSDEQMATQMVFTATVLNGTLTLKPATDYMLAGKTLSAGTTLVMYQYKH